MPKAMPVLSNHYSSLLIYTQSSLTAFPLPLAALILLFTFIASGIVSSLDFRFGAPAGLITFFRHTGHFGVPLPGSDP